MEKTPKNMKLNRKLAQNLNGVSTWDGTCNGKRCVVKEIEIRTRASRNKLIESLQKQVKFNSQIAPEDKNKIVLFSQMYEKNDSLVFVRNWIDGDSLETQLTSKFAWEKASKLMERIVEIVSIAHEKYSLFHGDLKPENIIVNGDKIAIIDWDSMRIINNANEFTGKTISVDTLGTPYYMAPEQCGGQKFNLKSDIYALGVIFYRLLTGKLPFGDKTGLELIRAKQNDQLLPIEVEFPHLGLPADLSSLVNEMLAKDPNMRLRSTKDFLAKIRRVRPVPELMYQGETHSQHTVKEQMPSRSRDAIDKAALADKTPASSVALFGHPQTGKTVLAAGLYSQSTESFSVTPLDEESKNFAINIKSILDDGAWPAATMLEDIRDLRFKILRRSRFSKSAALISFREYSGEMILKKDFCQQLFKNPEGVLFLVNPGGDWIQKTRERTRAITDMKVCIDFLSKLKKKPYVALVITASDRLRDNGDLYQFKPQFEHYLKEITNCLTLSKLTWKRFDVSVCQIVNDRPVLNPQKVQDPFLWLMDKKRAAHNRKILGWVSAFCLCIAMLFGWMVWSENQWIRNSESLISSIKIPTEEPQKYLDILEKQLLGKLPFSISRIADGVKENLEEKRVLLQLEDYKQKCKAPNADHKTILAEFDAWNPGPKYLVLKDNIRPELYDERDKAQFNEFIDKIENIDYVNLQTVTSLVNSFTPLNEKNLTLQTQLKNSLEEKTFGVLNAKFEQMTASDYDEVFKKVHNFTSEKSDRKEKLEQRLYEKKYDFDFKDLESKITNLADSTDEEIKKEIDSWHPYKKEELKSKLYEELNQKIDKLTIADFDERIRKAENDKERKEVAQDLENWSPKCSENIAEKNRLRQTINSNTDSEFIENIENRLKAEIPANEILKDYGQIAMELDSWEPKSPEENEVKKVELQKKLEESLPVRVGKCKAWILQEDNKFDDNKYKTCRDQVREFPDNEELQKAFQASIVPLKETYLKKRIANFGGTSEDLATLTGECLDFVENDLKQVFKESDFSDSLFDLIRQQIGQYFERFKDNKPPTEPDLNTIRAILKWDNCFSDLQKNELKILIDEGETKVVDNFQNEIDGLDAETILEKYTTWYVNGYSNIDDSVKLGKVKKVVRAKVEKRLIELKNNCKESLKEQDYINLRTFCEKLQGKSDALNNLYPDSNYILRFANLYVTWKDNNPTYEFRFKKMEATCDFQHGGYVWTINGTRIPDNRYWQTKVQIPFHDDVKQLKPWEAYTLKIESYINDGTFSDSKDFDEPITIMPVNTSDNEKPFTKKHTTLYIKYEVKGHTVKDIEDMWDNARKGEQANSAPQPVSSAIKEFLTPLQGQNEN